MTSYANSDSFSSHRACGLTTEQVTFPNGVFSGTIISSVVKNGSIEKTAEWQLLLGSIAIPGVLIGAWLCDRLGRKNTMMLGFSGYCARSISLSGPTLMLCSGLRTDYWMCI